MKSIIALFMLTFVFAAVCGQGIPIKKCPPGEHSVLYCPQMAEPSCSNPTVHDMQYPGPCDIPQCFCDHPHVRSLSGRCVPYTEC